MLQTQLSSFTYSKEAKRALVVHKQIMDPVIIPWAENFVNLHGPFDRVLELGGRDINGSIKTAFHSCHEYVSLDMIDGPGVDVVANSHSLSWCGLGRFDCVVATSFFEHDSHFWLTLQEVKKVLQGWMLITLPYLEWGVHDYPGDYYRYTDQAIREILFDGFKDIEVFHPIVELEKPAVCQIVGAWGYYD